MIAANGIVIESNSIKFLHVNFFIRIIKYYDFFALIKINLNKYLKYKSNSGIIVEKFVMVLWLFLFELIRKQNICDNPG